LLPVIWSPRPSHGAREQLWAPNTVAFRLALVDILPLGLLRPHGWPAARIAADEAAVVRPDKAGAAPR